MILRYRIRQLYEGRGDQTRWFLYSLLIFDFLSLLFIIATSFLPRSQLIRGLEAIGIWLDWLIDRHSFYPTLLPVKRSHGRPEENVLDT